MHGTELWGGPTPFADVNNDGYISDEEFAKWMELDLGTDSWVVPRKVNHSDLGEIWIGCTPPARYIEKEAEKNAMYMLRCLEQLPRLSFANYSVKKMSNNLYQVEVEIENANYYPTASDRSVLLDRYTPDVISAKVSSGDTIANPTKENTSNSSPFMMRNTYLESITPAGEVVEFRMKGSSKQAFKIKLIEKE